MPRVTMEMQPRVFRQGGGERHDAIMRLRDDGIPAYATAEQAVNAMVALRQYGKKVAKK